MLDHHPTNHELQSALRAKLNAAPAGDKVLCEHARFAFNTDDLGEIMFEHGWEYDIAREVMVKMSPQRYELFWQLETSRRRNIVAQGGPRPEASQFVTLRREDPDGALVPLPERRPTQAVLRPVFPALAPNALTLPSLSGRPEWKGEL